jgi:alpha(1,3/1,4) fucosyltransferase
MAMKWDTVVIDTGNWHFYENRLFEPEVASKSPGALSFCRFAQLAHNAGYTVVTGDVAARANSTAGMIVVTEELTPWTETLKQKGAALGAIYSWESPSFAWRFYRNLSGVVGCYPHAFLFPGAARRIRAPKTRIHMSMFPQPQRGVAECAEKTWQQRKFLAMVNSNLVRRVIRPSHVWASLRDPALRGELYSERRRAIRHFRRVKSFDLYGRGWQNWRLGIPYRDYRLALTCYRGECDNKVETLSDYRFSICFENAAFPGYITEKIFDCLYAGCVPIYYGAPDIDSYIPKQCFIDFRQFKSYEDLTEMLASVQPRDFEAYQDAARRYFQSSLFDVFSPEYFARELLDAIRTSFGGSNSVSDE